MRSVLFRVEGMHCKSCEMLIVDALEDLGVKKSDADKDNGTVKVHFDEERVKPERLREVIEEEGYKVFMQKTIG